MPLVSATQLMRLALRDRCAIGYFESWDLASLQGVIDAAENARAPVIVGFNGEFLSRRERLDREPLGYYAALGTAAANTARVPVTLLFNECPNDAWTYNAISMGFNLVMPARGDSSADQYRDRVAAIATTAHRADVAVEAELGLLPHGPTAEPGFPTDPRDAVEFVKATRIDLLAISAGNVHILSDGVRDLDLDLIDSIHQQVDLPLVLHGGTGISRSSLQQAICRGVAKVNFGTYLKQRYLKALEIGLASRDPRDPHRSLGYGGEHDLLTMTRRAVRDAVSERLEWLGCQGRADTWNFL